FLISSYKHIIKANTDAKGNKTLTPDEKGRLAQNFKGYDISPDMVRLSLVNLYLHGFADPHIFEYDTLTSQEHWNEYADVILANPPFMSPKGGIRPHKRFSVQSKRSEVLFVDYMAEHLTPSGRAGIIVPEGIIFQSQTAYKQLRKLLVEQYLVAVVSLPAGVFNPYSGVKTSILILDKSLAKKTGTIAFFKIENDGFGLGAQRREIDKNDLPQARAEIGEYLRRLRERESVADFQPTLGLVVEKERIALNGEYNLSGERYREGSSAASAWPLVTVGQVFRKSERTVLPESLNGPVTYIGLENIVQNTGEITGSVVTEKPSEIKSLKNLFKPRDILYGKLRPNLNKVWLADRSGICSTDIFVIEPLDGRADTALYACLLRSERFNDAVMCQLKGAQLPRVGWSSFAELEIPLPPLQVQKEIVAEIEGYQKVINGARAVLDNYHPHIPIHPDWPMVTIAEIAEEIKAGFASGKSGVDTEGVPHVRPMNITEFGQFTWDGLKRISEDEFRGKEDYALTPGDVLFNNTNSKELVGKTCLIAEEIRCAYSNHMTRIRVAREHCDARFLAVSLHVAWRRGEFLERANRWIGQAGINAKSLGGFRIPLPPLATQKAIVAEIEAEQALVAANGELVERFERKIQATLARIWGEAKAVAPRPNR
ncbi:MAG TPA: N-6 DNA methylase, partial [Phycisphaerae bacterium]|nr:N-6 DNA methylase [Phycisphaerae bacterium]